MNYQIIRPKKDKIENILDLCAAHAEFEKSAYDRANKGIQLSKDIWGKNPKLSCLVAKVDDRYVGYITWMKQYSTWDAREYYYMDCLYLDSEYRGYGIGEDLINQMKIAGKNENIDHVQWQTPEFNIRAIKFYKRIGATSKPKERFFLPINKS
jgi:ribosomal protein S18 acetylase RimI-like enzyme